MKPYAVLGTGMAGLGAGYVFEQTRVPFACYDKNPFLGGHTRSFRYDSGFLFDVGPHISFTKDTRIQDLFADSVEQQYETIPINLNNYWRGYWPQHPVQLHLHGLPEDVIVKVNQQGSPVRVRDLGTVTDSSDIQTNIVRVDGQRSVYLPVLKQGGDTNTIAVVDGIKHAVKRRSRTMAA